MNVGAPPKTERDELTWKWRQLHNDELKDVYSSSDTVRVMKSRRMRWTGYVARRGREKN
jgi:hypothetical protein